MPPPAEPTRHPVHLTLNGAPCNVEVESWVSIAFDAAGVPPLIVSFDMTLAIAVPPVWPLTVPASLTATSAAELTVTVAVASSQLAGLAVSQMR